MNKIFRRKTIFLSIFISLIFLTAATVSPAFLDSKTLNLLKRNSDDLKNGFDILDQYKDLTLEEIFYSIEKNQKILNNNEITKLISENNFFDLTLSSLLDLFEKIIPFDNINNIEQIYFEKILPFFFEMVRLSKGEISFDELSDDTKEIIEITGDYFKIRDIDDEIDIIQSSSYMNIDFDLYKTNYDMCDEIWHYSKGFKLFGIFGISEDNFYDWSDRLIAFATGVFWVSLFLTFISFFVIILGENTVDVFGWLLIAGITVYNAALCAYINNGYEYFLNCVSMEPEIIIHAVDPQGNGIANLEGKIIGWNNDAYNVCSGISDDQTVWKEKYFIYDLGTSVYMNTYSNDLGWYSLSERVYFDHIYEQAPCPPGNWTIKIEGSSSWQEKIIDINDMYAGEIVVIDVVLNPP